MEIKKPDIYKIEYIIDNCIGECHIKFFIHLNIDVYMLLNLQILQIMRYLF